MKLANKANPFPHGIPRTYGELVAVFAPRVIHDRIEFENASAVMNAMAGHALNKEQEDYLETLAILVDEYDRAHNRQPEKSSPLAVLRLLMEEHDLSGRDLGIGSPFLPCPVSLNSPVDHSSLPAVPIK